MKNRIYKTKTTDLYPKLGSRLLDLKCKRPNGSLNLVEDANSF